MTALTREEAILLDSVDPIRINDEHNVSGENNPYEVYRRYRDECPVYEGDLLVDELGYGSPAIAPAYSPVFTLTRYEHVAGALRDWQTYSNTIHQEVLGKTYGKNVLMVDPPEHRRLRSALQSAFARGRMTEWRETLLGPLIEQYLERLAERDRADLVSDLALTFPVTVIHKMLGLPNEQLTEFWRLGVGLLLMGARPDVAIACSHKLSDMMADLIQARRREQADDLVSVLVAARAETGDTLTDAEILSFVNVLLPAGGETTTRNIGTTMLALLSDEEQLSLVRENPEDAAAAVEEALRWEAPASRAIRCVIRDTEVGGVKIPAGSGVILSIASANHDERMWGDDAERFDLRRMRNQSLTHMAFAHGIHLCLGMHLARTEAIETVTSLLRCFPDMSLDPKNPPAPMQGLLFRWTPSLPVVLGLAEI